MYEQYALKIDVLLATIYAEFIKGEAIPTHWKEGITTLIYKDKVIRKTPTTVLSLLNADYKLFSAILANRFQSVLQRAISPNQNGFIKGRLIFENVRTVLECIQTMNIDEEYAGAIIALLDFNKAFDSISHDTIIQGLTSLGAPQELLSLNACRIHDQDHSQRQSW